LVVAKIRKPLVVGKQDKNVDMERFNLKNLKNKSDVKEQYQDTMKEGFSSGKLIG
jgi:hypothetical protein